METLSKVRLFLVHSLLTIYKMTKPQVLFLDIQLRNENAFQFLERIRPFSFEIIFVTAYDKYALQALKLSAVD